MDGLPPYLVQTSHTVPDLYNVQPGFGNDEATRGPRLQANFAVLFKMAFVTPIILGNGHLTKAHNEFKSRSGRGSTCTPVAKPSTRTAMRKLVTASIESEAATFTPSKPFSPAGMTVDDFFERSIGEWRSQRSSHNLAWTQFEQITSEIVISKLTDSSTEIVELCKANEVDVSEPMFSFKMSWEGESDWDDEVSEGESSMSVIKDSETHGRLLRSIGYAETIPSVGNWRMTEEGVFVLSTFYDAAAAEERIWFATPDLRMRVSQIRTSSGSGVVTASFSTEIRRLQAQ